MSRPELRGAMIGAGYFAGFQAEAWTRIPDAQIAAVVDPMLERAKSFAQRWNIPQVYPSAEILLKSERLDFVDIATRPETHLELTRAAAENGVNVICQKPMAPDWEQCLELVRTCSRAGVRLMMHENWRWQPWYREMKRLLDAGILGAPFHVEFRMRAGDGRGPEPYPVQPYFPQMDKLVMYEMAVHFLDTFRYLVGEIETIYCQMKRVNPAIRGEDHALALLTFESGAFGLINGNRVTDLIPPGITLGDCVLEGDQARIRLSPDGRLWFTEYGKDEVNHPFPTSLEGYKGDSVRATQMHLVSCLASGAQSESEGREYLKTVAAVFASYRSAESNQPIRVREAFPIPNL